MKKTLAILLTAAMLLCAAPLTGFTAIDWSEINPGGLLPSAEAAEIVATGTCGVVDAEAGLDGSEVTWTLDSDGLLTISPVNETGIIGYCTDFWDRRAEIYHLKIEEGITAIDWDTFYDCEAIESIELADSVLSIPDTFVYTAWYNNQPDGAVYLGKVFYDYKGEMAPNTTLAIKGGTLAVSETFSCQSHQNLVAINIPASIVYLPEWPFSDELYLESISVDSNNQYYSSDENGVLFNKDQTVLLRYPCGKKAETYTIPDTVTSIGGEAFDRCESLTAVTIPDSVTNIGTRAFHGCIGLTAVTIPDSVTSIGTGAFFECIGLTAVTIPGSVTSTGDAAFACCFGLTAVTIPDSVTRIGIEAFAQCTGLTTITIPDSVTNIGWGAFYECDNLTAITIPDSVIEIDYDAISAHTVIHGSVGSYAQQWSEENDRAFVPTGEARVTLRVSEGVNKPTVNAYGFATPGAKVVCSVNGTAVKTVNAAASGKWNAALPLAGASDGDVFTVKASVTVDGETDEQTATVTYRPDAILFDELTMPHSYYSATVKAADLGKANRNFTYVPGQPFSFKIRVTNNDKIGKLYIVSTKDGAAKRMELTYDSASDYWFVTGQFDNNAKSYVPGVLTVEGVDKNGSPFHTGAEIRFNFLIDPSGYAYEAVQDNVLEGVTARVFYRDAEGHEILWNADAYDQLNPITTLADGAFAWVVPEGTWQVRLSKDGYEDAASEWMDVPPEYTDVYIPMISYMPPQVRNVFVYTDTAEIIFSQYMEIESVNAETVTFSGYTGTLTPVDAAETAPGSDVYYAKTFRFATDRTFARSVDVMIAGAVNYAGYEMEQPYTAHVQTGLEPANLKANAEAEVTYGETAEITVTAQYAAGRTVTVQANTANVSLSAKALTLDENSKATVTVTGEMPGFAILTFTLEGTALTATTAVTVPTPKTPENPVTPTDPTTPTDPDQPTEPDTPDEPTGEECPYCHKVHDNTFFGRILRVFHSIAYFFAHLFGTM